MPVTNQWKVAARALAIVPIALASLVMVGCENPVREKVESSVAQSLPSMIGPARSYTVRADGPTTGMIQGRLDGLNIVGQDVKLKNGMTVSRLAVDITDIAFDRKHDRITRVGSTQFAASLSESELNKCLAARYHDVPGLAIGLRRGYLDIAAKPGVSIVHMSVRADAELEIRDSRILALNLKKLNMAGISAPGFARDFINSKLTCIFDARDLGFDARITSVQVSPGILTLTGSLNLMKAAEGAHAN